MSVARNTLNLMNATITQAELLRLRMRAQGLAGTEDTGAGSSATAQAEASAESGAERITQTASRMLAMQGQDWRSSRWALGVRTPGTSLSDVQAAFNEGHLVRSWPMRGTIHVVAAEDIGWMQQATNKRVLAGAPKRRAFLGMSDETLDRLVEVSVAALATGHSVNRDELSAIWSEAGIEWQSNWRYHIIWWLCQNGIATFGPLGDDTEPRLVLAETWIRNPRTLTGDDALCELATRYTAARGPVSRKDLAWWSGLTARETDRGFALAEERGLVTQVTVAPEGSMWVAPELLEKLGSDTGTEDTPRWRLLPAFDEHLLGYTERNAQLDPAHFDRIVPGRNGVFLATVVDSGRVVGTWKRGTGKNGGAVATPFPDTQLDLTHLQPQFDRWADFHSLENQQLTLATP